MTHAKGQIRISFVCFNAYKLFNPQSSAQLGGTELQMHQIAETLSYDPRFTVSIIVGDFGQASIEHYGAIEVISAFRLDKTLLNLLLAPIRFFRALRKAHPDIIISSPAGPEIGLLALYCFIFPKTKYIFRTASDVDCTGQKEKSFDIFSRFLYRFGIIKADGIVVQHEKQKSDMQKNYAKISRIISNGYKVPNSIIPIKEKKKNILWVGSSRSVKRADIFFSIVEELPEYKFDMVLSKSGDPHLYTSYKAHAQTLPNLIFHSELSPKETNTLISQSRILLGTSDYEGSPNAYILASMCGTPIISLHVRCQGICVHGDEVRMKQEIEKIIKDDAYAEKIFQKEISYARLHYDISHVIQDWISVIQEMYYSRTH